MANLRATSLCCAALLLLPAGRSLAAEQKAAASSEVDPDAMAALDRTGAALRSHQNFVVKADITNEDVLNSGQKLQYAGTVQVEAQRPDRFKISIVSDPKTREFYYDGKSLTVFSPRLGFYAAVPAPPTIRQTLDKATDVYGIEFPLADLFSWGTDKEQAARVKSAFLVGPEHIDGHVCNHYAFRQKRVDWQLWIAQDGTALPCKLVITDKRDPSMPQYAAVLHWDFPGSFPGNSFTFTPPSNAHKIVIARIGDEGGKGAKP